MAYDMKKPAKKMMKGKGAKAPMMNTGKPMGMGMKSKMGNKSVKTPGDIKK